MTVSIDTALVSLITGVLGSALFYVIIVVARFTRLEADVASLMVFFRKLQEKTLELIIRMDSPELDKLLDKYRNGEITKEELQSLFYEVRHQHIQAIRQEHDLEEGAGRKVSMAIFLAGLEADYERMNKQQVESRWARLWNYIRQIF